MGREEEKEIIMNESSRHLIDALERFIEAKFRELTASLQNDANADRGSKLTAELTDLKMKLAMQLENREQ